MSPYSTKMERKKKTLCGERVSWLVGESGWEGWEGRDLRSDDRDGETGSV